MRLPLLQLSIIIGLLLGTTATAGTIFKCRNAEGEMLYQEKPCPKDVQAIRSWGSSSSAVETDADSPEAAGQEMVIGQGRGGHYYVDGSINDNYLNFMIDTGATLVAIPIQVAKSARLTCQGQGVMSTGNGNTMVCGTTIEKLKFGHFTLRYVKAVVLPNLSQPLLGMNVLRQFRVDQDNGEMRLSKKY
jgi:aspartyl protease family protein